MKTRFIPLLVALLIGSIGYVSAQDYDDDIYYNPSKDKTNTVKKQPKTVVTDYPAADAYTPASTASTMDVDAYNRRGIFANESANATSDASSSASFANTRNIERFYNPQVVTESDDESLAQLYYSEPANVTININTPDYWGYPYYGTYYPTYFWGYPRASWYYNNWYYNSWAWNFGPSWSWSWGWGPSWSWYPSWSWGHGHYYPAHHHHAWVNRPSGNVRPAYNHRSGSGSIGNSRPAYRNDGTSGYRPGNRYNNSGNSNSGYRPGRGTNTGNYRGSYRNNSNNDNNGSSYRPGGNSRNSGSSYNSGGFRSGSSRGSYSGGRSTGGGTGRGRH